MYLAMACCIGNSLITVRVNRFKQLNPYTDNGLCYQTSTRTVSAIPDFWEDHRKGATTAGLYYNYAMDHATFPHPLNIGIAI